MARGIEEEGFERDYKAVLCASQGDPAKENSCLNLVRTKQVDGVVLVAASGDAERVQALITQGAPLVACDSEWPGLDIDTVIADNEDAGVQATAYLITLGHERVGCIAGPADLSIGNRRLKGYRRALKNAGIPFDAELVARGDFRNRGGFDAMNELLDLDEPPTAVFACNDLMAMGAICAASKRRLGIPEDVAIVGCDDIGLAAFTNPSLTTVRLPKRKMGAIAVEMLVSRIEGEKGLARRYMLPVDLVVRDSC